MKYFVCEHCGNIVEMVNDSGAVSYTHLDVYKRQVWRQPHGRVS